MFRSNKARLFVVWWKRGEQAIASLASQSLCPIREETGKIPAWERTVIGGGAEGETAKLAMY